MGEAGATRNVAVHAVHHKRCVKYRQRCRELYCAVSIVAGLGVASSENCFMCDTTSIGLKTPERVSC